MSTRKRTVIYLLAFLVGIILACGVIYFTDSPKPIPDVNAMMNSKEVPDIGVPTAPEVVIPQKTGISEAIPSEKSSD